MPNPYEEELKREFIERAISAGLNITGEALNLYNGIADWWLSKFQAREKELIKRIEALKEATQKETGSFKYDVCYDECIALLNQSGE